MPELKLNSKQKEILLDIARKTIEAVIKDIKVPVFNVSDPALLKKCGAFVTIHKKGSLRGCIGNIIGMMPLWETVRKMAAEAAVHDPRFRPVSPDEFADIDIEVSVLSHFEKITDINKIEVGKHGLFIKQGFYQGLLLPQVAIEYNWSREEFIEHTCSKAGLRSGCYKDKNSEIFIFTADVFGEKKTSQDK